jgi:hypothetical protein
MRQALSRASEARRLRRSAWFRVLEARLAFRLGRFQRAHDAASAALAFVPGDAEADALRAAAVVALGLGAEVAAHATPLETDALGPAGSAAQDETVGTGTTVSSRAPE